MNTPTNSITPQYPDLAGKAAVITGAASGIGFAIAEAMLRQGVNVVLNDIDDDTLAEAMAKLRKVGPGHVLPCLGDSSDPDFIRGFVAHCVEEFGSIDLVIANAGITMFGHFLDFQPENFDRVMQVNLRGTFFLVQEAAKAMQAQGHGGRVVLMGSNVGEQGYPQLTAYGMSKAALAMMSKVLIHELAPLGITLNTLAPGATLTERTRLEQDDYAKVWGALVPRGRVAMPVDIANVCLFLLSRASGHMVGETVIVDGGWTATSPLPAEASTEQTLRGEKIEKVGA